MKISAIHTAIERGVAVAKTVDSQVKSLVIARPERCVVEALSSLKGHPPRAKAQEKVHAEPAVEPQIPAVEPTPLSPIVDEKNAVHKKGKKA